MSYNDANKQLQQHVPFYHAEKYPEHEYASGAAP